MRNHKFQNKTFRPACLLLPAVFLIFTGCFFDPNHSHDRGHDQGEEARASFQYRLAADRTARFSVHGINGGIRITGGADGDSIEVWGERIVRSDDASDAEDHMTILTVNIQQGDSGIAVTTHQPSRTEGRTYEVNYHVRLPARLRTDVELVNGSVTVERISNDVRVSSTNGNVECRDIRGGCAVELVNGQIACGVALPARGACSLATVNGNVELTVPDSTSAEVEARVTNGNVSVSGLQVRNMQSSKTAFSGVLGGGEGTVRLTTVNGNIQMQGRE
jgi:hypothetical protein